MKQTSEKIRKDTIKELQLSSIPALHCNGAVIIAAFRH